MVQAGILERFYLLASSRTWAGGSKGDSILQLPGAKALHFGEGSLRYTDMYYISSETDQSFGQTVIWVLDKRTVWLPVWGMQYGGHYPKRVIDFLKTALQECYISKEFVGGRGPLEFRQGNLAYLNHPEKNEFKDFYGYEEVIEDGVQLGFHWYRGQSLLK